jgi:SAM-dependent methyltransferase
MLINVPVRNTGVCEANLKKGRPQLLSGADDVAVLCPFCGAAGAGLYCRSRTAAILQCRTCNGLYDPDRTGELTSDTAVARRAVGEYLASYDDNRPAELAIARGVVALLRKRLPAATRYLEFGCGNAAIAEITDADRLPITYTGIELSAALYQAINPSVRERVMQGPALKPALERVPNASQDVVILHHVLEHLPDPRQTLALLRQKLAAGGHFFIEVPNEQWKRPIIGLRRVLKRSGDEWFPGHINFFTQASLRNFLVAQGFQIEYERKVTAASYPEMVKKMLGGETKFHASAPARVVYAGLRLSKLESLIGYGIVLRCICRPVEPKATHE